MSLDTTYRPTTYEEVLGQGEIKKFLKAVVVSGKAFRQSYLFAGGFGTGKTTLARIFARAALCDDPQEGAPCDKCFSCISILETGTSECFNEVDAATKSGKADMEALLEEIGFDSFSGKRRIYLFDEAHQLTKDALDSMLFSLEENIPGTLEKRLVCIFCTTEPEKMRDTVFSRCAPAFQIQPQEPAAIVKRLVYICEDAGIEYDEEALLVIAAAKESHIRDALKAVEGISMYGRINLDNVRSFLNLDQNDNYLDILLSIGQDLGEGLQRSEKALGVTSPVQVYRKLSELSLMAYKVFLGSFKPPAHLNSEKIKMLAERGDALLGYTSRFAHHPGRPTLHMLQADLGCLHHGIGSPSGGTIVVRVEGGSTLVPAPVAVKNPPLPPSTSQAVQPLPSTPSNTEEENDGKLFDKRGFTTRGGVCIMNAGVNRPDEERPAAADPQKSFLLPGEQFAQQLGHALQELEVGRGGRQR